MIKSAMIRARVEERFKDEVKKILIKFGFSTTEAIALYYK